MENRGLISALAALGIAQALKIPLGYVQTGQWNWGKWKEPGGMPSSHSASVAALAAYTAMSKGIRSLDFAISSLFGMIVMYDAMGIRRYAGEIASEVNELQIKVDRLADQHPGVYHDHRRKHLKEVLGHMPLEVAAGMLLGIVVGTAGAALNGSRR